jgi:hypothetical protein
MTHARAAQLPTRYIEQHQRRKDYPAFRAQDYPIGTGTTESGVKQEKHRFSGVGMRGSRLG